MASFEVVRAYPHDRDAFTQGLVYAQGSLYEGTGQRRFSTVRRVALETGEVLQMAKLPDDVFGEGITLFQGKIFQLTLDSHVGYVRDLDSFEVEREFANPTEGWGITHDGARLILSDGSSSLRFLDPESLDEVGRIEVRDAETPVEKLNELEYVRGEVYANIFCSNRIARIDPKTGLVLGWIDLTGILGDAEAYRDVDVLNGIAYDPEGDRLFVTGKFWPTLFEIRIKP